MSNTKLLKRFAMEQKWLAECPDYVAIPDENNINKWICVIPGPPDSAYEGGKFKLDLVLPNNYPFSPPKVTINTKIFHPNFIDNRICLDIIQDKWSASLSILKVLLSISSLLCDPNPDSPLNQNAAELYRKDRKQYDDKVREYVKQHALCD